MVERPDGSADQAGREQLTACFVTADSVGRREVLIERVVW